MSFRPAVLALCATLFVAIIGCKKKESSESSAPPPPTAVVDPTTAGSITGTVKLEGEPPVFRPIDMSAEPTCVKANPSSVIPPIVITGRDHALANVVVYIKSGLGRYHFDTPKETAVLDQKGCMYVPRVLAVMVNQPIAFKNTDPTTHNIHPVPRDNHAWNRSLEAGEEPYVTTFSHPELAIPVACNIHPWMRAFLFVFDNPYFDVTPKSGDFEIKNVPPGTYTVEAWQERFGKRDTTLTIGPNESKSISFTFKPRDSR